MWALYDGDCLDPVTGLASLPDLSVEHVITDPPYDKHTAANSVRGNGHRPGGSGKKDLGFPPLTAEQMTALAGQFARVVCRWVLVFCAVEMLHDWRSALIGAGLRYVRCGSWVKQLATPQMSGDRPAVGFEAIVIAHRQGRMRWNGGGRLGVWTTRTAYRERDPMFHTTQKPVRLMRMLIEDFTDPGDLVCDPFAGSGTTGVACRELGRRFIGWERDPGYAATARQRIEAA